MTDRAEKRLRMCEISWLALAPTAWTPSNLEKMAAFLKSSCGARPLLGTYFFVHRGLKLVQLVKTACKHERFIEDLGDDIRVTPGFGFYLRHPIVFMAHMQSPVSGLASLLSEHELDNTPRSPEAILRGHCSVRGREFQSPFMVPRPLAPARAIRFRTCADFIQPCWYDNGSP